MAMVEIDDSQHQEMRMRPTANDERQRQRQRQMVDELKWMNNRPKGRERYQVVRP